MGDSSRVEGAALSAEVQVGICGAGAMGAGIAQVAALAGHPVRIFDTRAGAAGAAVEAIGCGLARLLAKGRLSEAQVKMARNALLPCDSISELAECGLVIEAIVEDLVAKQELFRNLEELVQPTALLATNTSSLSITSVAAGMRHPERLAGMHFFNPAPLMPLVEVISGAATSAQTAQTLHATALGWGKVPVYARSTPGFIVNRVARPFYAEALRVLQEGAADCATVDAILRDAGGFRMGPFELMDLIGHDVNYAVTRSVFDAFFGDARFTPSLVQRELVEAGFLGRKAGRGFYLYGEDTPPRLPATCAAAARPIRVRLFGNDDVVERLARTDIEVERVEAYRDGRLAECGAAVLYASDGRTATARAAANGVPNTVLIDLALDPATTPRLAISVADSCDPAALRSCAGLLQAAGIAVSEIDDIPGMIVLRTVAMLVNEAADALNQGVCSAADCDLAMRKGVNYPRGPLEWGDHLGLAWVVAALDYLAEAYGEVRYRVSPLLRRKAIAGGRLTDGRNSAGELRMGLQETRTA